MPLKIIEQNDGIIIHLKVVPGASRSKIMGLLGDALKIAVSKPPVDGAANDEVIKVLAESLCLAPRQIRIVAGLTNPRKQAKISSVKLSDLQLRLAEYGIKP